MSNYVTGLFFGTAWLFMIVGVMSPETVGQYQAKRDIAYESILNEHYGDILIE